jgi:hypothetical protein
MTGRKYDDKMHLDMPFAEVMERFVGTNPKEMHSNIAKAKTCNTGAVVRSERIKK